MNKAFAMAAVAFCGMVFSPVTQADTYVLVHGAWGGGYTYQAVDRLLTAEGHEVYRPTLSGLGANRHRASADIGLGTHIQDVVNLILYENLQDVVLVGHSYGGMVISGVYDQLPERIRRLVYVDAILPNDGDNAVALLGKRAALVEQFTEDGFIRFPRPVPEGQAPPLPAPQPLKTFTDPIRLQHALPPADRVLYILTVEPGTDPAQDHSAPNAERAGARGWQVLQMPGDHNVQRTAPEALVKLLLQ